MRVKSVFAICGRQRPVIIAVIAMWVMEMPTHEVVYVISVRHRLMPATRTVYMGCLVAGTPMLGCASFGICCRNLDHVLFDVVFIDVVKMPVVEIVDMISVADRYVATILAMHMCMTLRPARRCAWRCARRWRSSDEASPASCLRKLVVVLMDSGMVPPQADPQVARRVSCLAARRKRSG
jgi:hypothetical protein